MKLWVEKSGVEMSFNRWEGLACTIDVNDCLINPCENDGECTDNVPNNQGTNAFNCECKDGWNGTTCTNQTKFGRFLSFLQLLITCNTHC